MSSPEIVVFGASGLLGGRIAEALRLAGVRFTAVGRRAAALGRFAAPVHLADARDPAALARAFAGARVVVNAAGPLRETAAPVLVAALAAGAHYVDVGGEQAVLRETYERHDALARRSGLVALPGAGLDCLVGDLASAWAAAHLTGTVDDGPLVRSTPAPRIAEDRPLDEISVSYVFDDLALSPTTQRALFGSVGERALVWRRDRWEAAKVGDHRRVVAGAELGGERDAIAYAGGDALTIPRHVAAQLVGSFASTTRKPAASGALRLLAIALPLVPRTAAELLAPYVPREDEYARTRFAIVTTARRGTATAQVVVRGVDIYRTAGASVAWLATQLAARAAGPVGFCAPGELLRGELALREIASRAALAIEPSFGA